MAALTFADVLTRVQNQLRIPTTNTEQATRLAAIVNAVYRDVRVKAKWAWDEKRQVINTSPSYAVGTVTMASGSAGGTFNTAPAAGLGSFAQRTLLVTGNVTDPQAWFRISAHTAGAAAFTLDAPYTGADTSTSAFTVYLDRYDLATDCGTVKFVTTGRGTLTSFGPEELEDRKARQPRAGQPEGFSVFEFDTTGDSSTAPQLVVEPYPDQMYRLEVHYEQQSAYELSGTDAILIPPQWVNVLIYGTLARAYPVLHNDIDRGTYYLNLFNDLLALMSARNRDGQDQPKIIPRDTYRGFYRGRKPRSGINWGSAFDRLPYEP